MHVASAHTEESSLKNVLHSLYSFSPTRNTPKLSWRLCSACHLSCTTHNPLNSKFTLLFKSFCIQSYKWVFLSLMPTTCNFWPQQLTFIALFCFFDFTPIKCWIWILVFSWVVLVTVPFLLQPGCLPLIQYIPLFELTTGYTVSLLLSEVLSVKSPL